MSSYIRVRHVRMTEHRGLVYLLHLDPSYMHCGHYIGFTEGSAHERLLEHHRRNGEGAALTEKALNAGCKLIVVRLWPDVSQGVEFLLKAQHHSDRFCPICNKKGWMNSVTNGVYGPPTLGSGEWVSHVGNGTLDL